MALFSLATHLSIDLAGTMSWKRLRPQMSFLSAFFVLLDAAGAQDPDPNISDGICYYSVGNQADSRYIPCGNAALAHFSCCESQDMCLSNNACYNGRWGVTYLAGCSDSSYSDDVCPGKGALHAQQWVGLSYCNGTSDEWAACDDSGSNSNTVTSPEPCSCPATSATIAFVGPSKLDNFVSLPSGTGSSLICTPGMVGCSATVTTTSSASSTPSSTAGSVPSSTSNTSSSSYSTSANASSPTATASSTTQTNSRPTLGTGPESSPTGLSTGAKAGVGVGAGVGGIITIVLLWLLAIYIRRHNRNKAPSVDAQIRPRSQALAMEKDTSDEMDPRSPAWSGHKSELPAEERNSASVVSPESTQGAWTRPTSSEMEGSMPTYQSMGSLRLQAMGDGGPIYQPYRKANAPPVGVSEAPGATDAAQAAYRPGKQVGSGVYEMPAQVPGSTLPW